MLSKQEMSTMEIIQKKLSDIKLYVKPIGKIDVNTAAEFGTTTNDLLDDIKELVIDFAEISYISSIGLRVLLELQKRMNQQGSMTITNVSPEIMQIFTMTGFSNILTIA